MVQHSAIDHTGITGTGGPQALDTTDSPQFAGVNLGHASDTTLTRVSAGVVAIEGTNIVKAGAATGSGITMATARLLGRTSASTGAIEEITVGSGLSLAGGSLSASGGGGSVVPNLIMNYTQSADINGVALTANTWVDVLANQNFTVANASSLVGISVRGFAFNNVSALQQGTRLVIDSAGTPINEQIGGQYMSAASQGNFFAGSNMIYISGLSAAVHTIKLQANSSNGTPGSFYCRATANAPFEFLRIQIVEFLPA